MAVIEARAAMSSVGVAANFTYPQRPLKARHVIVVRRGAGTLRFARGVGLGGGFPSVSVIVAANGEVNCTLTTAPPRAVIAAICAGTRGQSVSALTRHRNGARLHRFTP